MAINRKLGKTTDQRLAMLRCQATDLILRGKIETTEARAKEVRKFVDKMITYGKDGSLVSRRKAYAFLHNDSEVVKKIFDELHLHYQIVLADTGAIGGNGSHQFMALSDVGESDIIYCDKCGYAADIEKASSKPDFYHQNDEMKELEKVHTPGKKSIEEVSEFLNVNLTRDNICSNCNATADFDVAVLFTVSTLETSKSTVPSLTKSVIVCPVSFLNVADK